MQGESVDRLKPMLDASSVAIVGASPRAGSVGHELVSQLLRGGFEGDVRLVNPNHTAIHGRECLPDLEAAGPVDLAVLAVGNQHLEDQMAAAIAAGAGSVAIFASCFGDGEDGSPLSERLGQAAAAAGIPVCGGNGMGFVNLVRSLRVTGYYQPWDLVAGGVSFLSHSGSLFSAMLHNHRNLRFNLVVSSGNEMATTMDEYLAYSLEMPSTRVVGLFLETVRNPAGLATSLTEADARGVPIVALKVGRTDRSRASIATHSAAIAGDFAGFEAFAEFHGVHLVETMDEMLDALQLFASERRAFPGGIGSVHDSGGERSLFIDTAARVGAPLASLGSEARSRIGAVLAPGLEPENPIDAWGTGVGFVEVFEECLGALAHDDAVGVVVYSVDMTPEERPDDAYGYVAVRAAAETPKPVVVLSNVAGTVDPADARYLADSGIPVLRGTETGLRALRHFLDDRDRRQVTGSQLPGPPASSDQWRRRLSASPNLSESEALDLLAAFGLDTVPRVVVDSEEAALAAARSLGFPLALKTASGAAHKTELDGVLLGIDSEHAVALAYRRLATLGAFVQVQAMAPAGIEMALGLVRDEQFGLLVMVAAGGVLIEVLSDRSVLLPPIDRARGRNAVDRLRIRPLLDGVRGEPAVDVDALVDSVLALSAVAVHLADAIESLDVNPVIVHENGCVAVDALVVTRLTSS